MIFCHIFKVGVGGGFFKEYQNEVYSCYLYIKTPPLQLQEFKNSKKKFIITLICILAAIYTDQHFSLYACTEPFGRTCVRIQNDHTPLLVLEFHSRPRIFP